MEWPDLAGLPARIDALRTAAYVMAVVAVWWLAGRLQRGGWLQPGDARKINHLFGLAGGALWFGWLPADVAEGSWLAGGLLLFVLLAVVCGCRGQVLFATLFAGHGREGDAPLQGTYVWTSWLLAVYGLSLTDLLFGMTVTRTAALLLAVGDGVGEPVGVRLGRHPYYVPVPWPGGRHRRTVEGSVAVFAASLAVALCCFWDGCVGSLFVVRLGAAAAVGLAVSVVEAVSPRGTDNFTVPVAGGALVGLLAAWGVI